jgi:hypothetical protein
LNNPPIGSINSSNASNNVSNGSRKVNVKRLGDALKYSQVNTSNKNASPLLKTIGFHGTDKDNRKVGMNESGNMQGWDRNSTAEAKSVINDTKTVNQSNNKINPLNDSTIDKYGEEVEESNGNISRGNSNYHGHRE